MRNRLLLLGVFVSCGSIVGCGSKTAHVTGKVTLSGTPVAAGSVILFCQDSQILHGVIHPDGTYTIPNVPKGVASVAIRTHTRVPAGFQLQQKIPVTEAGPVRPDQAHTTKTVSIPRRYSQPEESGLQISVSRSAMEYDIELQP